MIGALRKHNLTPLYCLCDHHFSLFFKSFFTECIIWLFGWFHQGSHKAGLSFNLGTLELWVWKLVIFLKILTNSISHKMKHKEQGINSNLSKLIKIHLKFWTDYSCTALTLAAYSWLCNCFNYLSEMLLMLAYFHNSCILQFLDISGSD